MKKPVRREYHRAAWSGYTQEQIQIIARELLAVEAAEGVIRTRRLVELARDKSHPLHPFIFRLTDRDAAEKWRLEEARNVCRAVEVRYVDDDGDTVASAPLVVSCRVASPAEDAEDRESRFVEQAYRSTERAMADPATRKSVLDEALREAEAWKIRYGKLRGVEAIVREIDRATRSRKAS